MLGNRATTKDYRSGGSRGGRGQFNWEDIKSDQHRQNYLGHSLLAPVGRWQKGKDLTWFTKVNNVQNNEIEEEKRRIREQEEDLLNEAVGVKSKKKRHYESNNSTDLDDINIKKYLTRETTERSDAERVRGLGGEPNFIESNKNNEVNQVVSSNIISKSAEISNVNELNPLIVDKSSLESIMDKLKGSSNNKTSKHDKKEKHSKHKHKSKRHDRDDD